ncbi:hypothetical protein [Tardiphaga robiniae]|uniref:Uncharacterized protein n=1 Tax=Tardiphaga robiniae TaxID=943830 RepID=A0A7G6TTE8_9BRAD|nr:hypothetical protein [Tardiphaga robiniae]QND70030.1 hypothetical protein HB776_01345 [Tardiphaga robiniae]
MRIPSSFRILVMPIAFMTGLPNQSIAENAPAAKSAHATPKVVMAADPQPPFTYWAPEYSTIRNHPRQRGIWIAEAADGSRKYYFGDQCRASEFQSFVGQSVDALPERPANATWRLACSTCAGLSDMDWMRMNVTYDQKNRTINDISCG